MSQRRDALELENGPDIRSQSGVSPALWEASLNTYRSFGFENSPGSARPKHRKARASVKKGQVVKEKKCLLEESLHTSQEASPMSQAAETKHREEIKLFYHIINKDNPQGLGVNMCQPENIDVRIPNIKRPRDRNLLKSTLNQLPSVVFFARYSCGCDNTGTCIHFQFCVNRSQCPYGMLCDKCFMAKREVITTKRKCPLHQNPNDHNPCGSRTEDFFATPKQQEAYEEILKRSTSGIWDDGQMVDSRPSLLTPSFPAVQVDAGVVKASNQLPPDALQAIQDTPRLDIVHSHLPSPRGESPPPSLRRPRDTFINNFFELGARLSTSKLTSTTSSPRRPTCNTVTASNLSRA